MRVALLGLLLLAGAAGDAPPFEGGRFTVFAGGREAGHEAVEVEVEGKTLRYSSKALLHRSDRAQDLELAVDLDRETGKLLTFRARGVQGELERVVTLARTNGELAGEIREGERAEVVTLPAEEGAVVLAEPFVAPWLLVAARYDLEKGGPQRFPAVFPLAGRAGSVEVTSREEEAVEIDGRVHLLRRLLARPDEGDVANLWVDARGRLLVCARSVAGISAVRGSTLRLGLKPGADPPEPAGVSGLRVRFAGPGVTLAGTFERPTGRRRKLPAVLLLTGSGPHDRNGNVPGAELQWNYLHTFAGALSREGLATLRYDERGVGGSSGTFYDAGLTDLVNDAAAALEYLRSREDVDPERIGVLGHSEGALIAARLAAGGGVKAVVLLGAPAESLDRVLLWQLGRRLAGREERERQRVLGEMRAFFEHVRLSRSDTVRFGGRVREATWLREHLELDPETWYGKVRCPALVLQGERDVQVPPRHAERVVAAIEKGGGEAERKVFPTLDHYLMPTRGDIEEYGDARRNVAEAALRAAASWFARHL